MAYAYNSLVAALQTAGVIQPTDANWLSIIPTVLDQAEQRIYRDLDLLSAIVRDSSASLSANSRDFILPQTLGYFMTVKGMSVVVNGIRQPLRPVSIHYIDATWPSETPASTPSIPQYFAPLSDQNFVVGPSPSSNYGMEVIGTIRPTPLSAINPTTFLTAHLSDLLFAASMSAVAGYQRDYGAQTDDPRSAVSWEQQYAQRLASASKEEAKRKFQSGDWVSESRPAQPTIGA